MSNARANQDGHASVTILLKKLDDIFLAADEYTEDVTFRNIAWVPGMSAHSLLEQIDVAGGRLGKQPREILLQWKAQVQARRNETFTSPADESLVSSVHNEYCKASKFQAYVQAGAEGVSLLLKDLDEDANRGSVPLTAIASHPPPHHPPHRPATEPSDVNTVTGGMQGLNISPEHAVVIATFKLAHGSNVYDMQAVVDSGLIFQLRGRTPNSLSIYSPRADCWCCHDQRDAGFEWLSRPAYRKRTGSGPNFENLPHKHGLAIDHNSFECPYPRRYIKQFLEKNPSHINCGPFKPLTRAEFEARIKAACEQDGATYPPVPTGSTGANQ